MKSSEPVNGRPSWMRSGGSGPNQTNGRRDKSGVGYALGRGSAVGVGGAGAVWIEAVGAPGFGGPQLTSSTHSVTSGRTNALLCVIGPPRRGTLLSILPSPGGV